jgi:non-specific serine/threonine protein kinase
MKIILANPRGFCAGVNMAIECVKRVLQLKGAPVYVYHEIVHNLHVVQRLAAQGVVFVNSIEEVPPGSTLVYSAHGVAPEVRREAEARNLVQVDATCPLVTKVHLEAIRYARQQYTIILIGHKGHDEVVGTLGEVPQEWLDRYKHLFNLGEETEDGLRFSNQQVTLLDQLLGESERVNSDDEFKRRRERLREFTSITPQPLPQNLTAELRPYQKAGVDWLHFLREYQFGGCLADDMGLGKTVQVLAFLQAIKEKNEANKAALVVVPKSLLTNWQREIEKFTPGLRALEYHGYAREKDTSVFDQYDLVITTYGVVIKDIELLRGYRFHYAILDESQAIKNPVSQSAKACRLLLADHRLVMTGTPVENSSFELWSQFAFLNPGLLGNLDYFKSEIGGPIERDANADTAQFLRKMVYPFILRRTKEQVAPELPPRTERVIYGEMEPAQRKIYTYTRERYRQALLGLIDGEGVNNARMKILEGLLRLRNGYPPLGWRFQRGLLPFNPGP